jgi:outer membrane lipoprotein-sorting protein
MRTQGTLRALFLLGPLLFSVSAAEEPFIMNKVRSLYTGKTTLETSFTLHIFWKVREKEETKNGRLYCAPGDKFRIELGGVTWVCDGETYWQNNKDENGEQVVIKRFSDLDAASHPSHLLSTYLGNYVYHLKEERGATVVVEWKADMASRVSDASDIRLSIDRASGAITALFIVDKNGNESAYSFKKTKLGAKLPEALFDYKPPKGASILDLRK